MIPESDIRAHDYGFESTALSTEELRFRAAAVRCVFTDNDGTLTDGRVHYSERGEEMKVYSLRDGHGFERLRDDGLKVVIVTREPSPLVVARATKLKATLHSGVRDKLAKMPELLGGAEVASHQAAYFGDDVNDLGIMKELGKTGLVGCPADAELPIRRIAHFVSNRDGGHGAFRDFAEWVLSYRT